MSNQELADELLRHWQLLWPLPASERIKRINEIEQDLVFERQLRSVTAEMANA